MDLFNVCYETLLLTLQRFFAHTSETDAQLMTLADVAVNLMLQVIKPLGELITTRPAGEAYPGATAGPSFELFYENDYLLPHRDAACGQHGGSVATSRCGHRSTILEIAAPSRDNSKKREAPPAS